MATMMNKQYIFIIVWVTLLFIACTKSINISKPELTLKNGLQTFGANEESQRIRFTSSSQWSVITDQPWCKVSPLQGEAGENEVIISVIANESYDERNSAITLTNRDCDTTFTIVQKQKDALMLTSSKAEVPAIGGKILIEIKANIHFEYTIEEKAATWITPLGTRGLETSILEFEVKKNDNIMKREGKITIHSSDTSETFTIYQSGITPELILTQNNYTLSSDATEIKIELKSNVPYEMQLPNVDWITEKKSRAVSSYTHNISISANESYNSRTAEIQFRAKDWGITEKVSITQLQKDAIIITQNEYTISEKGGNLKIEVSANIEFKILISVDWIKYLPNTRVMETSILNFTIEPNLDSKARQGTITISHANVNQQVTINQNSTNASRLKIKHNNQSFHIPIIAGRNLFGSIAWGDGKEEPYSASASHDYNSLNEYTVTIEIWGAEEMRLNDIIGVNELNLKEF
ncbi:hypothetical protein CE91St19_19910 [Odoribacter laneus]|jgi:hypothetical protein|uniref:BACON domain-containing protein n=2 Tax=Odoribacter laneus TaxID=626933 RepID=UPI0018972BF5|nr:BACON domain-containing protein [Odoribacter laneus]GKI22589.1 hypothetical protein CE91St19_19910 [Odoribacter laneus]GKI25032.1 hypothetical protein CE91St20_11690 [Odoribacter laneus]